jgi:orotidine-5'-phosphate decarboxylase
MNADRLFELIRLKESFLCVGLDTDPEKLPACLQGEKDPVTTFNRAIIEATAPYAVAYKPNTAFFEAMGTEGWELLRKTSELLPPDTFRIADAKRGDIGNTSNRYAKAFFEAMDFDGVTVAPYMGRDSVEPFLGHPGRWAIVLALTSNPGSADFQLTESVGEAMFERVLRISSTWGTADNTMYVVGATRAEHLSKVRQIVPEHFLLVPGVGAQGGSLGEVAERGMNQRCGLLVNASRSIIYASSGDDFAQAAAREAAKMRDEMAALLKKFLPAR